MGKMKWLILLTAIIGLTGCGGGDEEAGLGADALDALNRGWAAYGRAEFSTALLDFERAAKLDTKLADAHNGVGWSHLSLVDGAPTAQVLDLATQAFNRALQADSNHADAWVGLGHALFLRRKDAADFTDAAKALASARDADAKTLFRHDYRTLADIYSLEGWAHFYAGETDSARAAAQQSLKLQANTPSARLLSDLTQ